MAVSRRRPPGGHNDSPQCRLLTSESLHRHRQSSWSQPERASIRLDHPMLRGGRERERERGRDMPELSSRVTITPGGQPDGQVGSSTCLFGAYVCACAASYGLMANRKMAAPAAAK